MQRRCASNNHKCLDVDKFKCETITRSSFVNRVCYLEAKQYMIIKLKETYYHRPRQ